LKKVLIIQPIHESGIKILEPYFDIKVLPNPTVDEVIKEISDSDGVIVRTFKLSREIIENATRLKIIVRHGVGVDNIDVELATQRRILVANTPNANTTSVVEHTIMLIMALAKNLIKYDKATRTGNFEIRNSYNAVDLEGKVLGIIGMGRIGRLVCQKVIMAFKMEVLAYDPYVSIEEIKSIGAKAISSLEEFLPKVDFLSIHVPLTNETRGLISKKELNLVKKGSYFINTSRGSVVDEDALLEALRSGHLAGAGLDVFEEEPPDKNNPLFKLDNVIVTPHSAALTRECVIRMATDAAETIRDVLLGKKYINSIRRG